MSYLVTGASRGIGLAVARRIAAAGHGVTLCARNVDLLNTELNKLPRVSGSQPQHDIWRLDMSDLASVGEMAGCPQPLTNYRGFINCAGIAGTGLLAIQSVGGIQKTLNVNLLAPILMAKHMCRAMLRKGSGSRSQPQGEQALRHLIFMSSILAARGAAGSSVYSATKAGLEGFTRSLAREVATRGIAVNCIAPGIVDTDMGVKADQKLMDQNAFPGMIDASEVAESVMYLLNAKNITGTTLTIDNGCSI